MTVVMMRQMSLENSIEKSEKKNDQDQVDGMRQEVYSKGKEMHNEMSGRTETFQFAICISTVIECVSPIVFIVLVFLLSLLLNNSPLL